eukprot:SAG11_NODE_33244_length_278_cov_0.865922_1_plen_67_part_10
MLATVVPWPEERPLVETFMDVRSKFGAPGARWRQPIPAYHGDALHAGNMYELAMEDARETTECSVAV